MIKKILSLVLSTVMILSCLAIIPFTATAASEAVYSEGDDGNGNYVWSYDFTKATAKADLYPNNGESSIGWVQKNAHLGMQMNGIDSYWYDEIYLDNLEEIVYIDILAYASYKSVYYHTLLGNGTDTIIADNTSKPSAAGTDFEMHITYNPATGEVTSQGAAKGTLTIDKSTGALRLMFDGSSTSSHGYVKTITITQQMSSIPNYVASFSGEGINIDPITSKHGALTLPETPDAPEGFIFGGWSDGVNIYPPNAAITISDNVTFEAVWTAGTAIKATFTGIGTENVEDLDADAFGNITLPDAPENTALYFVGWSDGTATYDAGTEMVIDADTEFTAVWREFVLTFTGVGAADPITATDAQVVLPDKTADNGKSVFMGWKINGTIYAVGATVTLTADTVATASWQAPIYSETTADNVLKMSWAFGNLRGAQSVALLCPNGGNAEGFKAVQDYYVSFDGKANAYWYDYVYFNNTTKDITISISYTPESDKERPLLIGETEVASLNLPEGQTNNYGTYSINIVLSLKNMTVIVNGSDPIPVTISEEDLALGRFPIRINTNKTGGRLRNVTVTQEIVKNVWVSGHQQTDVENGTYNVRFIAGVGELVAGQSAVGFEITTNSGDRARSWTKQTSTVYESISANYGADTLLATEVPGASYLTALAITGIPATIEEVVFTVKPYVIIAGEIVYGEAVTITVTPTYPAE